MILCRVDMAPRGDGAHLNNHTGKMAIANSVRHIRHSIRASTRRILLTMNGQEKYPPIHINVPSACSTATGTTLAFALAFAQCLASALAIFLALVLIGFVLILSPCLLLL